MSDQTLFGRRISRLNTGVEDKPTEPRYERKLPLEINPKILHGFDLLDQALICAVANSTATVDGKVIPYAVSFEEQRTKYNGWGWWFNVLTAAEEDNGWNMLEYNVEEDFSEVEKLLKGKHESLYQGKVRLPHWQYEVMRQLGETSSLTTYKTRKLPLDETLVDKVKNCTLQWRDISKAAEQGSFVGRRLFEGLGNYGFFSDSEICLFGQLSDLEGNLLFGTIQDEKLHDDTSKPKQLKGLRISDAYIGGVRYDEGADATVKLVEFSLDLDWGGDTGVFRDLPPLYAHIESLYRTTDFLHAQGYTDTARTLRRKVQDKFVQEFEGIENEMGDEKMYWLAGMQEFLELAKKYDQPTYEALKAKAFGYQAKIEEIIANDSIHMREDFDLDRIKYFKELFGNE